MERRRNASEAYYRHFLQGYISGYNAATLSLTNKKVLVGERVSDDTIIALFKNKCRQDALKHVGEVANDIYIELKKRAP